ncbi:deoxyribodipyrimidine photo-lyase [Fodinibius salsisoli]|uniref:Deoxyribodipyrimidine photo-lyase n=1 Tax=Fodinibius salsisoli TaxID=2820877 RepID=A0ABT3PP32_9BACT|nr:deoxyribodipyrimidine photo-lyase [Fodinibius salsisoli]
MLLWFRNDLRIHDSATLYEAAQADYVTPIYIFDELGWGIFFWISQNINLKALHFQSAVFFKLNMMGSG